MKLELIAFACAACLLLAGLTALPLRAASFDRSANVPAVVMSANTALGDYKKANRSAETAARRLAGGYMDLPEDRREEAKARDLLALERNLKIMEDRLGIFYRDMSAIQAAMETGGLGKIGAANERIGAMITGFTAELAVQERSSAAMRQIYEISPDAVDEASAQKLNLAMDAVDNKRGLLKKLRERRERVADMEETIQQKIENVKAVLGAVEVRLIEVEAEATVASILIDEHKMALATKPLGMDIGAGGVNLFGGESSRSLDAILDKKDTKGMSQRELLKYRLGRN